MTSGTAADRGANESGATAGVLGGARDAGATAGVDRARGALATDLYELTMGASYLALGMDEIATFSLFARSLPPRRSFLVVAGVEEALRRLVALELDAGAVDYLRSLGHVRRDVLDALARTRFQGDVRAVPEGRVVFAGEPILEVRAPIVQAQLVETTLLNAVHFPTLVATKAARCVSAAPGKPLVDFSFRRAPGIDAGIAAARACYLAGFSATSNVLAGHDLGIPVAGALAHACVELFPSEVDAFYAFAGTFPGPVTLLVDTYNARSGVAHAIEVARALEGSGQKVAAVRLDSGDLASLAEEARRALDEARLRNVRIVASGDLDEVALRALERAGAPIDEFGVGTRVGVSADVPALDLAYRLVDYGGRPCLTLSQGKETLVGPKQVFRCRGEDGRFAGDVLAAWDEPRPGAPGGVAPCPPGVAPGVSRTTWEPLLEVVMRGGRPAPAPTLDALRARHRAEIEALPEGLLDLDLPSPYPVTVSPTLKARQRAAALAARRREGIE
jgi:nicotinate phosphoribosyltransferase